MGDLDKIVTTGFSKMSDRQVSIWETGGLGNVKTMTIDQSAGVIMPFWSDNGILFLAGKGDGNIRYYEYESDSLFALAEHKSPDPQRGMCFLPRRALSVSDCEIARAYKVSGSSVEPIAFIVPRKADSFQSDIYPAAASSEASLSASEFFAGKTATLKLVSLENGAVFNSAQSTFTPPAPAPVSAPTHAPAPTAFSAPPPVAKAVTMPTPVPQTPVVLRSESAPMPRPASPISESPVILTPPTQVDDEGKTTVLEAEVDRLNGELRAAREKIRNMELQVEGLKANARKAAQALMEA
jgi:coronin-1B/1C/6